MTKEMLNQIENDYWEEKASPIDMTEVFDLANKALEQETNCSEKPTSSINKNDLGVDCVARQDIERYIEGFINEYTPKEELEFINLELDGLKHLPSVTPQLSSGTRKNSQKLEKDCVSRQAITGYIDYILSHGMGKKKSFDFIKKFVANLPSVTPQEPRCKDCKWWKDSDGAYRRGLGVESQCPINTHTVYCGEGYCYMFKPQESEDKE